MEASLEAGVKRFVYASSSSVYGDEPNLPKVEGREGKLLSPLPKRSMNSMQGITLKFMVYVPLAYAISMYLVENKIPSLLMQQSFQFLLDLCLRENSRPFSGTVCRLGILPTLKM